MSLSKTGQIYFTGCHLLQRHSRHRSLKRHLTEDSLVLRPNVIFGQTINRLNNHLVKCLSIKWRLIKWHGWNNRAPTKPVLGCLNESHLDEWLFNRNSAWPKKSFSKNLVNDVSVKCPFCFNGPFSQASCSRWLSQGAWTFLICGMKGIYGFSLVGRSQFPALVKGSTWRAESQKTHIGNLNQAIKIFQVPVLSL